MKRKNPLIVRVVDVVALLVVVVFALIMLECSSASAPEDSNAPPYRGQQ